MHCHKCKSKVAVINKELLNNNRSYGQIYMADVCLPCIYKEYNIGRNIMPMTAEHLKWIAEGRKCTTLRSLKYDKFPFEKVRIFITKNYIINLKGVKYVTKEVVKSEGYKTFEELSKAIKKRRFKLPQEFWLYFLENPLTSEEI